MTVTQVELKREHTQRVCWVDRELKVGDIVTLKNDTDFSEKILWEVTYVYTSTDIKSINRHWNNNI